MSSYENIFVGVFLSLDNITTYQVQNEASAVSDRLLQLQNKICEDAHNVIYQCESQDELDFLFPELMIL
jgi:hypothetical protein